jgi:CDP-paratose 2-epimerase
VRDCLHPRDLIPLLRKQTALGLTAPAKVVNLGGGINNAMSLAELSGWCRERFGPHDVGANPELRRFDIPWMVMDSALAKDVWG